VEVSCKDPGTSFKRFGGFQKVGILIFKTVINSSLHTIDIIFACIDIAGF
jgi:hypothetical protein